MKNATEFKKQWPDENMEHVREIKKRVKDSNMKTRTLSAALAAIISLLAAAVSAQLTVTSVINNGLHEPYDVAVDASGNFYVCDSANNRIIRVDASTLAASTLAGIVGRPGRQQRWAARPSPLQQPSGPPHGHDRGSPRAAGG